MATACRFGQGSPEEEGDFAAAVAGRYAGDATIFEVACYSLHRLEEWLAANRPAAKEALAGQMAFWLAEIFAVAWHRSEEQVERLLAERLEGYRRLAKNGDAGAEAARLVLATGGDRLANDVGRQVPEAERQFAEASLAIYEKSRLPVLFAAAADYCARQQVADAPVGRDGEAGQELRDYRLAMALLAQKDFLRARSAFGKVLATNPDNYDALLQRGRLQVSLREPAGAIEDFSRAIAISPGDFRAYLARGSCYHRVLRLADKALNDYDKAISLAPDEADGHFSRGALFDEIAQAIERQAAEAGDHEKLAELSAEFMAAVNGYSRAIDLAPGIDEAYVGRGLAYTRKAKAGSSAEYAARAVADLEKAMELNWENGYLYKTVDELKALLGEGQPANV